MPLFYCLSWMMCFCLVWSCLHFISFAFPNELLFRTSNWFICVSSQIFHCAYIVLWYFCCCLLGLFFFLISALEECLSIKPWWLLIGWWANWAFHMFIFIRKKDNFFCYCSAYVIDVLKVRIFFFTVFKFCEFIR